MLSYIKRINGICHFGTGWFHWALWSPVETILLWMVEFHSLLWTTVHLQSALIPPLGWSAHGINTSYESSSPNAVTQRIQFVTLDFVTTHSNSSNNIAIFFNNLIFLRLTLYLILLQPLLIKKRNQCLHNVLFSTCFLLEFLILIMLSDHVVLSILWFSVFNGYI